MCGIVGAVSERDVAFQLLECLKIIEYRGYDDASVVILDSNQKIQRHETMGKVQDLLSILKANPLSGNTGIGNTNWVRNNADQTENLNPHVANDEIALVQNGIVENKENIRKLLLTYDYKLHSPSDVELAGYLVYHFVQSGLNFIAAVRAAEKKLEGSFSIGFMRRAEPGRLLALRRGSTLVIGLGTNENFMTSDHIALLPFIKQFIYLEDGDIADIRQNEVIIYNEMNERVERKIYQADAHQEIARKGKYNHFMQKEIYDQPDAILSTLQGRLADQQVLIESFGRGASELFKRIQRIQIVADGESFHAALVGRHWIEEIAGIPCQVKPASNNYYPMPLVEANTLFVTISQSGEAANTVAVLRKMKHLGYTATLTIGNMPDSTLVRESDLVLITGEGPETSAISTKAFTAQLCALFLLAMALGRYHYLTKNKEAFLIKQLENLPKKIQQTLGLNLTIEWLAKDLVNKNNIFFLANGIQFPIAMEAASKFKEVSSISARAYPANEFGRSSSMDLDYGNPIISLTPTGEVFKNILHKASNYGSQLIIIADEKMEIQNSDKISVINMPNTDRLFAPMTFIIPMQLLAYHVSVLKGVEIDKPYNVPKSANFSLHS